MNKLQPMGMRGANFNIVDPEKFDTAIKLLAESIGATRAALFCADNLITWNRNLSFLREDFFANIVRDEKIDAVQRSTIWRIYILLHFAELASVVEGDFVEIGCNRGFTAEQVIRKIDLSSQGKQYYLYDLFEWKEGDLHSHLESHDDPEMYQKVVERFAPYGHVHIIKGCVPDSFSLGFPEKIAFAHIDMNQPAPEAAAWEAVLPRLSKGGAIIFDDYGWWDYSAQKVALDPIAEAHGIKILELPTGQGLALKR